MTNLTSVTVTAGVPTVGTGTVSTIDNLPNLQLTTQIGNGTSTAAIKAASTAPIATDPALVTTLSPNSAGIVALGQNTMSASVPVAIASNQGSLSVNATASATGGATYKHIAAGQATTVVKNSAGTLYGIVFNSAATATNTTNIYDNASGSGTVIGIPVATTATIPGLTLNYGAQGIAFLNGLTIITATANGADMTVIYQ